MSIATKFAPFQTTTHAYKVINGHEVLVDVLVPKKLLEAEADAEVKKQKRPLVARFHGGGLIGGQRDYAKWVPDWLMDLVAKHDAVYVSPDYRLLPEASGAEEILDDIDDFFKWVALSLPGIIRGAYNIEVDLDRIFVTGDSAGGYLAIQSGLSFSKPTQPPRIRAVVGSFPLLGIRAPFFTQDNNNIVLGAPLIPFSFIDEQIALLRGTGGRVTTNADLSEGTDRVKLMIAVVQHGKIHEWVGPDRDTRPGKRRVHPEDRVEDGSKLPPTLIYHGTEDSAVPNEGSEKFINLVKDRQAVLVPGEGITIDDAARFIKVAGEHGVGGGLGLKGAGWITEVETFVERFWLGN